MSWEALSAIASLASAVIVLVAAVAAVLQLRHLRLANQLESYLEVMTAQQSPEFIEARRFLQSQDFTDPVVLRAATFPELDNRIVAIGAHFQFVSRLLNLGVLDEELFASYYDIAPRVWKGLAPVAAVMRERMKSPIWIDIEYLVYRTGKKGLLLKALRRYPADFVNAAKLTDFIAAPGQERIQ